MVEALLKRMASGIATVVPISLIMKLNTIKIAGPC